MTILNSVYSPNQECPSLPLPGSHDPGIPSGRFGRQTLGMAKPNGKRLGWWIRSTLLFTAWTTAATAIPHLQGQQTDHAGVTTLAGSGFGESCKGCEVIADYGTLRYALEVQEWSDRHIRLSVPDLNLRRQVELRVVTPGGRSNGLRLQVPLRLVPAVETTRIKQPPPRDLLAFYKDSRQKVGAKGVEDFDVSAHAPACGGTALLYDHANIVFGKRRFGDAQIVATPRTGCTSCEPLKVRWYHEPTGYLEFQVQVYRRRVEGICAARKR